MNTIIKISLGFLLLTSLFLFFNKCASSRSYSPNQKTNVSNEDNLNAYFYFYRNTDTTSVLYAMFNTSSLLFTRLDTGLQFYANVKITVHLNSLSNNSVTDSSSKVLYIPQGQDIVFDFFNIPATNDNYNAKITITDLNKKIQYRYYTELNLTNAATRQNFLMTLNDKVVFKPYVMEGNEVKIYHRYKHPALQVDVFKYHHTPTPPPFANITPSLNYLPDSTFSLPIQQEGYFRLKILPNRYYHIRLPNSSTDGFTVFGIDSVFPNIRDAREMLYTSRYIMNKNEFEKCHQLSNIDETKKCVDNFWLQIAGSKERAKEVIKNYYRRVIDANRLFTSYKYGWQTDRGMIYIVFGPPEDIQKNYSSEKWFYSLNGQRNALVFTFYKNKNNPFTNSDFVLERSDYYKDLWYFAVEKIRQGRLSIK